MKFCQICQNNISKFKEGLYDTRFGIGGNFDIYKCNVCNLIQLDFDKINSNPKRLYETYYNFGGFKKDLYTTLRTAFFNSRFYRLWNLFDGDISFHSRRGRGELIDIGCNEGRNLRIYKKNGFSVEGFEVNERASIEAKKDAFKVYNQSIETFLPPKIYDIAILSNVLEHSFNPKKMLQNVNLILKPRGRILISVPNIDSWQRIIFGRFWINWHVPFHIYFFSDATIQTLIKHAGFHVIKSSNSTPSLWMAQSIIAAIFTKRGKKTQAQRYPFLVGFLLFFIRIFMFPILFIGNLIGRGDCLIIEAIKNDVN